MAFASQVQMYVQPTLSAEIASLFLAGTIYFVLLLPCFSLFSSFVRVRFFFAPSSSLAFIESDQSYPCPTHRPEPRLNILSSAGASRRRPSSSFQCFNSSTACQVATVAAPGVAAAARYHAFPFTRRAALGRDARRKRSGSHAAAIGGWRYVAARQPALRQKKKARRREAFDTARALSAPAPPARAQRPRQAARALPRLLRSR